MRDFAVISTISWEIIGYITAATLPQAHSLAAYKYDEPITVVLNCSDNCVLDAA